FRASTSEIIEGDENTETIIEFEIIQEPADGEDIFELEDEVVETEEYGRIVNSGFCGDSLTWILDDTNTLTISGVGPMDDYDSSKNRYAPWPSTVEKVVIESGVSSIGDQAFIESSGFAGTNLKEVTIPNTVTSIGSGAFAGCNKLTKVVIPEGVTTIKKSAFRRCTELTEVYFPSTLTEIGAGAFKLTNLKNIVIPDSVKSIGPEAFNSTSLESVVLSKNITKIESTLFGNCENLKTINIPESVTEIGYSAFHYCTSMQTLVIPSNVTCIGGSAFEDCSNLQSVTIPKSMDYISREAFNACNSISDVYYTGSDREWDYLTKSIQLGNDPLFLAKKHFDSIVKNGIDRIYGPGRYETSLELADELYKTKGGFTDIIISYGENFPDALAGGYLAAQTSAPIILVKEDENIQQSVLKYLNNRAYYGARIMLLGSKSVVSESFELQLNNMGMGYQIERYGGTTRFETNIEILKAGGIENGSNGTLFVSSANGFADSLSASSSGLPLMITGPELSQVQLYFLNKLKATGAITDIQIIGSDVAVSKAVEDKLKAIYGNDKVGRLAGPGRYETSAAVAEYVISTYGTPKQVVLAYGENFPDGLCGGPVAYGLQPGTPLLLINNTDEAINNVKSVMTKYKINDVYVVGGSNLITDETVLKLFDTY
ncbi:MAG: leucine-rich repeat protein, partial [Erysipelotrichaceae bacterium]|nr:leucine-rich repeat protein [Erysipelotrichaceae bacterium]